MPGPVIATAAHVLGLAAHGDDYTLLTLFGPADGVFSALRRASRRPRPDAPPPPDLFDRLDLRLEHGRGSPTSGPLFVREHRLLLRHEAIGRDYTRLAAASRLARLVSRNPGPPDSRAAVDTLLTEAFAAFARPAARPDLVYWKSLYRLARDEGLPLKQDWLPTLPAADVALAADALRLPAEAPAAPAPAAVSRLARRLEAYLAGDHDWLVDPA